MKKIRPAQTIPNPIIKADIKVTKDKIQIKDTED
jgi:hypothetical protein